jgi:predicted acetyltransferase/DNA-binding MarR family transcriptional regulator
MRDNAGMASPPLPFDTALYRVYSAFRCELSHFTHENQRRIKAAGLTPQQFSLLVILGAEGEGGLSVGEAAIRLHIAHNSVVELSQRAETAGLLTRSSPGGRRQGTQLLLTEHGLRRLDEITAQLISEMDGDRMGLIEALTHWNTVLSAKGSVKAAAFPDVALHRAGPHEKALIWRLLQLYLDELSVPLRNALNDDGEYDYPAFDRYWEQEVHAAYLFQVERRPAGFALVRQLDDRPAWHGLDEFCVLRAYRGRGVGAALAGQVLRAHPGRWSVAHLPQNLSAIRFWDRVLPRHATAAPLRRENPASPGVWQYELEVPADTALSAD